MFANSQKINHSRDMTIDLGQLPTRSASHSNNGSFIFGCKRPTITSAEHPQPPPQHDENTEHSQSMEQFLRYRCEAYLKHGDNDSALFFAERLLSEHDTLGNRLLVAKCYKELHQLTRAYHVLQPRLRHSQINYQRHLTHHASARSSNKTFINPITPNANFGSALARGGGNNTSSADIGFSFTPHQTHLSNQSNTLEFSMDRSSLASSHRHDDEDSNIFSLNFCKENQASNHRSDRRSTNVSSSHPPAADHNTPCKENDAHYVATLNDARYFLSLVCFELGRYDECEEFLLGKKHSDCMHTELRIPNGVYGVHLLAKVFHRSGRSELAIDFYRECLDMDSYHFGAISALCELGENPGTQIFQSKDCVIPIPGSAADVPVAQMSRSRKAEDEHERTVQLEQYDAQGYQKLQSLFENLSLGYFKLQQYYPHLALSYFNAVPTAHFASAWVLNNTARCYYEMNDYQRAIVNWSKQIDLYPYDLKGMDYYSTALWHLKKTKELTLLSQHCSEIDKTSAATWIVMGNCFSLHKSHDLAIKFFKKAYCIDTHYPYAFTLAGHEYVVNEDFDSALKSFQSALGIDRRHYNAWYGLGNIYQFQQNYKQSLYHFKQAIAINPNSCVLYVCLSNIYKLLSNYKCALQYVDRALTITHGTGQYNLTARLERANIFILLGQYKDAIAEFNYLLQIIPNEWKLHFHLGEVYMMVGNKDAAMMAFNRAMSLNPKDKNTIKHAMQNVLQQEQQPSRSQSQPEEERQGSASAAAASSGGGGGGNAAVSGYASTEESSLLLPMPAAPPPLDVLLNRYRRQAGMDVMDVREEDDDHDDDEEDDDDEKDDDDEYMDDYQTSSNDRTSVHAVGHPTHSHSHSSESQSVSSNRQ